VAEDQVSEEGTTFQLSKNSIDEYEEDDLHLDSIGKGFFCGQKVDLAASGLLNKRFTMKGIRERVSIVDNKVILTFVKEGAQNSPRMKEGLTFEERHPRPKVSTFNAKKSPIETNPKEKDTQNSGPIRYYKSRESAINHFVFYLNENNKGNSAGDGTLYKKIDLNKVKPQLISSDDKLTFGVNTSPFKEGESPDFPRRIDQKNNSLEDSPLIARHIAHVSPFEGSILDELKTSPKRASIASISDNHLGMTAIEELDVDIVELKNIDQTQIREIISLTIEERSILSRRINHLSKRLQVLERILQGNEVQDSGSDKKGSPEKKKAELDMPSFEKEGTNWTLNTLMHACKTVQTSTSLLMANDKPSSGKYAFFTRKFVGETSKKIGKDLIKMLDEYIDSICLDLGKKKASVEGRSSNPLFPFQISVPSLTFVRFPLETLHIADLRAYTQKKLQESTRESFAQPLKANARTESDKKQTSKPIQSAENSEDAKKSSGKDAKIEPLHSKNDIVSPSKDEGDEIVQLQNSLKHTLSKGVPERSQKGSGNNINSPQKEETLTHDQAKSSPKMPKVTPFPYSLKEEVNPEPVSRSRYEERQHHAADHRKSADLVIEELGNLDLPR
jgi:hypothetical protein